MRDSRCATGTHMDWLGHQGLGDDPRVHVSDSGKVVSGLRSSLEVHLEVDVEHRAPGADGVGIGRVAHG